MDPVTWAVLGVIMGGTFLKMIEHILNQPKALAIAERNHLSAPAKVEHCMVWDDRRFEQDLVDAGISTVEEMTTCEDNECPNCAPTRNAIKYKAEVDSINADTRKYKGEQERHAHFLWLKKNDPRYKNYRYSDYVFQQKVQGGFGHTINATAITAETINVTPVRLGRGIPDDGNIYS